MNRRYTHIYIHMLLILLLTALECTSKFLRLCMEINQYMKLFRNLSKKTIPLAFRPHYEEKSNYIFLIN